MVTSHYGLERNSEGKIMQNLGSYGEFEVIFNDLTLKEDTGTIDQAIDTINKAFSKDKKHFF